MSQKSAAYDASGAIIGFYDDVDSPAPKGVTTINLTDAEWLAAIGGGYKVAKGALVAPSPPTAVQQLASAQSSQIKILRAACASKIVSGFESSALGAAHIYPSEMTDQTNLIGAVASAQPIKFWCQDSTGAWIFADHTAAQIKQVLDDGVAARLALSTKLADLSAQVNAAKTVAAVQKIVWA